MALQHFVKGITNHEFNVFVSLSNKLSFEGFHKTALCLHILKGSILPNAL